MSSWHDMTLLRLSSGKCFVWDGKQFFCKADYTHPRFAEFNELIRKLAKSGDFSADALADYLESMHGKAGLELVPKARHALDWIGKEGRFLRSLKVEELRRILARKRKVCSWCGGRISKRRNNDFCSDTCRDDFLSRCDPYYIRARSRPETGESVRNAG